MSGREADLAIIREAHAPQSYEFKTDQTYCPSSGVPSDQCHTCIVLALLAAIERGDIPGVTLGRPRCDTCNDTGQIDWMSEFDPNCYMEPDADGKVPCPDCQRPGVGVLPESETLTEDETRTLTGTIQRSLTTGETGMSDGDCNRAGWHVSEAVVPAVERILASRTRPASVDAETLAVPRLLTVPTEEAMFGLLSALNATGVVCELACSFPDGGAAFLATLTEPDADYVNYVYTDESGQSRCIVGCDNCGSDGRSDWSPTYPVLALLTDEPDADRAREDEIDTWWLGASGVTLAADREPDGLRAKCSCGGVGND